MSEYRKIPATMSTQHPDNVNLPSWSRSRSIIQGEDEIYEAYFAFKELGCHEQMWDWEGKDVDPHVVRKLLLTHPDFFREKKIGVDVFLTYRVPNPSVEKTERKALIEVLESIPRCYDVARDFYGGNVSPPIFEVILPLTKSYLEPLRVLRCYRKLIVERENVELDEGFRVRDLLGEFKPEKVEVIPLVEDKASIINIDAIVGNYIKAVRPGYLRVFIARSDPALNYGLLTAVLLSKLALFKLRNVSEETNTAIYPIIGTGCPPFRGHLTPENLDRFLREYEGYTTATVQSALKYDYPPEKVKETVKTLNEELRRKSRDLGGIDETEEENLVNLMNVLSNEYRKVVEGMSELVNYIAGMVPRRRARKLHIGLFGYSREVGRVRLPRAIEFTCSMYSLGIPPEFLGVSALTDLSEAEWNLLEKLYVNWRRDLEKAAEFVCWPNINCLIGEEEIFKNITLKFGAKNALSMVLKDLEAAETHLDIKPGPRSLTGRKHENICNNFLISLVSDPSEAANYMVEAAKTRGFLG